MKLSSRRSREVRVKPFDFLCRRHKGAVSKEGKRKGPEPCSNPLRFQEPARGLEPQAY